MTEILEIEEISQAKKRLEPIYNWAARTRKHLKGIGEMLDNNFKIMPLVVELVGMPGTGKTRLGNELVSKYFKGYQCTIFPEPAIITIPKTELLEYREEQFSSVCDNLGEVLASVADIAIFDRGILDFIVWFNVDHLNEPETFTEEFVQKKMKDIRDFGSKVDVVIVMMNEPEEAAKTMQTITSTSFMDSFGLTNRSEESTILRYRLYQALYKAFFCSKEATVRQLVKYVLILNEKNFARAFQKAVIILCLYLVFKTWESIYWLSSWEGKQKQLVDLLVYPMAFLHKLLLDCDEILKRDCDDLLKREFVIGSGIKVKSIFSHLLES